jgi:hypothetical protein
MRGDDGKEAVARAARALEAEILARTGVNVRGTAGETALDELTDAGLDGAHADALLAALSALEEARFAPSGVTMRG